MTVVDTQAHNVDGFSGKAHRNLHACDKTQPKRPRLARRGVDAADLVMVGQRQQLDAIGERARDHCFGLEPAVRDSGMAVQIGVEGTQPVG